MNKYSDTVMRPGADGKVHIVLTPPIAENWAKALIFDESLIGTGLMLKKIAAAARAIIIPSTKREP